MYTGGGGTALEGTRVLLLVTANAVDSRRNTHSMYSSEIEGRCP